MLPFTSYLSLYLSQAHVACFAFDTKMEYFLIFFIIMIVFLLSKYINISKIEREKLTAYECGFQEFVEEVSEIKKRYYIKYYIIAIIFLIFDLEILLLYPFITSYSNFLYQQNNSNISPSFAGENESLSLIETFRFACEASNTNIYNELPILVASLELNKQEITFSYIIIIFFIILLFLGLIFETNKFIII